MDIFELLRQDLVDARDILAGLARKGERSLGEFHRALARLMERWELHFRTKESFLFPMTRFDQASRRLTSSALEANTRMRDLLYVLQARVVAALEAESAAVESTSSPSMEALRHAGSAQRFRRMKTTLLETSLRRSACELLDALERLATLEEGSLYRKAAANIKSEEAEELGMDAEDFRVELRSALEKAP